MEDCRPRKNRREMAIRSVVTLSNGTIPHVSCYGMQRLPRRKSGRANVRGNRNGGLTYISDLPRIDG